MGEMVGGRFQIAPTGWRAQGLVVSPIDLDLDIDIDFHGPALAFFCCLEDLWTSIVRRNFPGGPKRAILKGF